MKKLFFVSLVAMLAASCATMQPSPPYVVGASAIDLGKYNTDSMFITTGDYFKEYEPVGIVEGTCFSGYVKGEKIPQKPADAKPITDDVYGPPSPSKSPEAFGYKYKKCTYADAIEAAIDKAKAMGANAIVKIDITYTYYDKGDARHYCIYVTGMAIRRK